MDDDRLYRAALRRVRAMKIFYMHLIVYVAVNLLLFLIDMMTTGGPWFFWPLVGWGFGLALQGVFTFGPLFFDPAWEERKVGELVARERNRRGSKDSSGTAPG
ncbi:MAG: 2TM domain-containing protein [Alphaproteobacteria bacterium]|nr:2TM domain-containing protein [Alphaproteobacteria bacterium]